METEVVARLTIHKAAEMTPAERRTVADWLRRHAKDLVKQGTNYSRRFTARHYGRKI